jgi:hypothetical protein
LAADLLKALADKIAGGVALRVRRGKRSIAVMNTLPQSRLLGTERGAMVQPLEIFGLQSPLEPGKRHHVLLIPVGWLRGTWTRIPTQGGMVDEEED